MGELEFYAALGIKYLGQQERPGAYPLDMFLDLQTGSAFIRRPFDAAEEASDRIRKGFKT